MKISNDKFIVVALYGEAGSGKDTILARLTETDSMYHSIISATTRPIRENEKEGINYFYLSNDAFSKKILSGEMLEATIFNDWAYGTPLSSLRPGKVNIGVFNPDGIIALKEHQDIDLLIYYVRAKPKTRLMRQLTREKNPNIDEIIRRYKTDQEDFDDIDFYSTTLINEEPEDLDVSERIIKSDVEDCLLARIL